MECARECLFAGPLNGQFWSARQRWRVRECDATWYKQPSRVTVRGAVMSYGGLNSEQSSDAILVFRHVEEKYDRAGQATNYNLSHGL